MNSNRNKNSNIIHQNRSPVSIKSLNPILPSPSHNHPNAPMMANNNMINLQSPQQVRDKFQSRNGKVSSGIIFGSA